MNRRSFTKVTGVSLVGVLAGCTSLGSESIEEDPEDDESPADDETAGEDEPDDEESNNESNETGQEDDEESNNESNETSQGEADDEETDEGEPGGEESADDTNGDQSGEADDGDQSGEADDEDQSGEADDGDQSGEADDGDQSGEANDEDQSDDDEPPTKDEISGTVHLDSDLEGVLEVVDHEFVWESSPGSHLCNVRVELRNTSSDADHWFEGIVTTTTADGSTPGGDIAQFGLGPQETTTHNFSMDQCADVTGYRLEFESH